MGAIRDRQVAAPLKLGGFDHFDPFLVFYPRPSGRGPIEALMPFQAKRNVPPAIRDRQVAAPLKPEPGRGPLDAQTSSIRDRQVAAPLKQAVPGVVLA